METKTNNLSCESVYLSICILIFVYLLLFIYKNYIFCSCLSSFSILVFSWPNFLIKLSSSKKKSFYCKFFIFIIETNFYFIVIIFFSFVYFRISVFSTSSDSVKFFTICNFSVFLHCMCILSFIVFVILKLFYTVILSKRISSNNFINFLDLNEKKGKKN